MPMEESILLHEFAARKVYLDSALQVREGTVIHLENALNETKDYYEELLLVATKTTYELEDQKTDLLKVIANHEREKKTLRKKLFWARVQTGGLFVISGLIIYLTTKD